MQSFLEFSAEMEGAQGGPPGGHDLPKEFTTSNAVMIHWGSGADLDGFLLYTRDLCKAIHGPAPDQGRVRS
jgi:hypothetical protein